MDNNIKIELFYGDSLDILPTLEKEKVDLIVTDPPYKMTKRGKSCRPNDFPRGKCRFVAGGCHRNAGGNDGFGGH